MLASIPPLGSYSIVFYFCIHLHDPSLNVRRGSERVTSPSRPPLPPPLPPLRSGVPAVVDFAAMRDAVTQLGGDPEKINPVCPADLVIDHSIQVDFNRK